MENKLQAFDSLGTINLYAKGDIKSLAEEQIEVIREASSPEQAFAFLTKAGELIERVKKGIMPDVVKEVAQGNNSAFGVKMTVQTKGTWKYDHDPEWRRLKKELEDYQELMKVQRDGWERLNSETGEVTTILPAKKETSAEFIKFEY